MAPPGFEDAVAWMRIVPEGHAEAWQVSFTVADRDASAASSKSLGGTVVDTEDSSGRRRPPSATREGAEFVLSQFTPPGS